MIGMPSRSRKASAAPPQYLSHFNLREPPFGGGTEARFFHADPAREQCLNMLQHLTHYSEELLLVEGPRGVGKSSVLQQFVARDAEHLTACRIEGRDVGDAGRLFGYIAQCFGLNLGNQAADGLLDGLRAHLSALNRQQIPVILIDDAHLLSDDGLEIALHLASLEGNHGKLVRLVLFAEPNIEQRFSAPRFSSAPKPHRLQLQPFDEGHTGLYLAHRLSIAGFSGPNPFDAKAVRRIYKGSEGLPARINMLADEILREKMRSDRPGGLAALRNLPLGASLGVGAVVLSAVVALVMLGGSPSVPEPEAEPVVGPVPTPPRPVVVVAPPPTPMPPRVPVSNASLRLEHGETVQIACAPNPEPPVAPTVDPQVVPQAPAPAREIATAVAPEPVPAEVTDSEPAPAAPEPVADQEPAPAAMPDEAPAQTLAEPAPEAVAPTPTPTVAAEATGANLRLSAVSPSSVTGSRERQRITLLGEGFDPAATVMVGWGAESRTLSRQQVRVIDAEHLEVSIVTGSGPERWWVRVTNPDGSASERMGFDVAAPAGRGWVVDQPTGSYTLQLLAASKRETVDDFLRRHKPAEPYAVLTSRRGDQPLFVIVQGSHRDKASALRAAEVLARDAGIEAWPRPLAGLASGWELRPEP